MVMTLIFKKKRRANLACRVRLLLNTYHTSLRMISKTDILRQTRHTRCSRKPANYSKRDNSATPRRSSNIMTSQERLNMHKIHATLPKNLRDPQHSLAKNIFESSGATS